MTIHVVLVDSDDNIIGTEEKLRAHQLGLLHRAFSVFVYRRQGSAIELLLQQRHIDKYHCGGLWTNTCCSHPAINENIVAAAERRLQEEMSMALSLRHVAAFEYRAEFDNGLIEHELDHVLLGEYHNNSTIQNDPKEVQDYRWLSMEEIDAMLRKTPEVFTPWFHPALNIVKEALCRS